MAAPNPPVLGVLGSFVINVNLVDIPVWNEVLNVKDIETSLSFTDVDVSTRAGAGYKNHEPALGDLSFSSEHVHNPYDLQLAFLRAAALSRSPVDVALMDAGIDVQGAQGFRFQVKAFSHKRSEPVDGIMNEMFDWKACIHASGSLPQYIFIP